MFNCKWHTFLQVQSLHHENTFHFLFYFPPLFCVVKRDWNYFFKKKVFTVKSDWNFSKAREMNYRQILWSSWRIALFLICLLHQVNSNWLMGCIRKNSQTHLLFGSFYVKIREFFFENIGKSLNFDWRLSSFFLNLQWKKNYRFFRVFVWKSASSLTDLCTLRVQKLNSLGRT
jgi:hypothetical protein